MRRVIFTVAVLSAVLTSAGVAAATSFKPLNCSCGALHATGHGWIGMTASGSLTGRLLKGSIWIRDRDGGHDVTVTGHVTRRTWDASRHGERYVGTNLAVHAHSGAWWVRMQGTGVDLSAVAKGSAWLEGKGHYHLNWGGVRSWPQYGYRSLSLRG